MEVETDSATDCDTLASSVLPLVPESLVDLFLWVNPVHSSIIFLTGLIAFFLVLLRDHTILSLIALTLVIHLTICFLYINGATVLGRTSVDRPRGVPSNAVLLPPETIESLLRQSLHSFNTVAVSVYNVYQCQNNLLTAQVLVSCYFMYFWSLCFSDLFTIVCWALYIAQNISNQPGLFDDDLILSRNKLLLQQTWDHQYIAISDWSNAQWQAASDFITNRIPALAARAAAKQRPLHVHAS